MMARIQGGAVVPGRPQQAGAASGVGTLNAPRSSESTEHRGQIWHVAQYGIDLCRRGQWKSGLAQLSVIESWKGPSESIPGLALTYLGYCIASQQKRIADGLRYCRAGVDRETWQAENHLNLARTYLLAGKTKRAIAALENGLAVDPTHAAMVVLRLSLGVRRPPTFSFLDRRHPLNRITGKLRHHLSKARSVSIRDAHRTVEQIEG
jgi:hypothetical protein